jgi:hypothetical protein
VTVYSLVNSSTAPELTAAILVRQALDAQQAYDTVFAPVCRVLPIIILVGDTDASDRLIVFQDDLTDAPGALAYHSVDDKGRPVLYVGMNANRSEGGNLLDVLSESWTHEVFETARNPFVNRYLDAGGLFGSRKVADEACDPVQGSGWRQGATLISNFTLPSWGDIGDVDGPWDHSGALKAAFQCAPTGYLAFDDGTQTFGASVSEARRVQASTYARTAKR